MDHEFVKVPLKIDKLVAAHVFIEGTSRVQILVGGEGANEICHPTEISSTNSFQRLNSICPLVVAFSQIGRNAEVIFDVFGG